MKHAVLLFLISISLSGCATEDQKEKILWVQTMNTPYPEREALYSELLSEGKITRPKYDELYSQWKAEMPKWEAQQKENQRANAQHERMLASLTPAQRLDLEMRQRELDERRRQADAAMAFQADQAEQQRQFARRQAFGNAMLGVSNQIQAQQAQRSAEIDAQIRENSARMTQLPPQHRSYDSTVTPPSYRGGPYEVHTEQTGGN